MIAVAGDCELHVLTKRTNTIRTSQGIAGNSAATVMSAGVVFEGPSLLQKPMKHWLVPGVAAKPVGKVVAKAVGKLGVELRVRSANGSR